MNKIVVITGATSGLGKYLKEKYIKNNDIVISLSRNEDKSSFSYPCDVSNESSVCEAFKNIKQKHGKIDILINNAGVGVCGVTELLPKDQIDKNFNVNFYGVINCTKEALPLMDKTSKIFNINSVCSLFPTPYRTIYCASKSATHMLSMSMRMELIDYGIEIVSICPGEIKTNFSKNRVICSATNERSQSIEKTIKNINERDNKRMSLEYAGDKIFKICNKKHTKPFYIVGKKYKLFYLCSKILPTSLFNSIIKKIFV